MFERIRNALKKKKEIPIVLDEEQKEEKILQIRYAEAQSGKYELPFTINIPESEASSLTAEKVTFLQLQELKKYIAHQSKEMNKLRYKVGILTKQVAVLKSTIKTIREENTKEKE